MVDLQGIEVRGYADALSPWWQVVGKLRPEPLNVQARAQLQTQSNSAGGGYCDE